MRIVTLIDYWSNYCSVIGISPTILLMLVLVSLGCG